MHAMRLLENWLQRNTVIAHQARVGALVRVVGALLNGGRLALTHLGRHRRGQAFVKHHIKAVDRLLGNRHLYREREGVYRALARTVLEGVTRPVILVDWADSALAHKQLILKAAVPVKGRALSLYEEVHPMRCYNNARIHRRFLHRLQSIVPEGCCPIIVTDAGFRGPWFRDVEALGWAWVGRIRNRIKYLRPETGRWCYIHDVVFDEGTPRTVATEMGQGEPAAAEKGTDDPHQRSHSGLMTDDGVALQPVFQQSHRVHAVLSDSDDGFATTIRSDDSMHVDSLTDCISSISYRNSWGYFRCGIYPR